MQENKTIKTKILSQLDAEDFIGRTNELDEILRHAKEEGKTKGLLILSAPFCGLSELLKQTYDQLFYEQGEIIPVYFAFSSNDQTAEQFARRFLQTFLLQVVAFRRNAANLLNSAPDVCELAEIAVPSDGYWIDRLVSTCEINSHLKDKRSFVKQALSAPLRAKAHGANVFLMFDNFQQIENIKGEINLLDELKEIYERSSIPFVFAGRRRYVLNAVQTGNSKLQKTDSIRLNPLSQSDSNLIISRLAEKNEVAINPQTVDLITQQFEGNPMLISSIFMTAKESKQDLDSFQKLQQTYVDSALGGRIGRFYETLFAETTKSLKVRKKIIDLLANEDGKTPIETWRNRLNLSDEDFENVIRILHVHEIIQLNAGAVEFSSENEILRDYLETRYRLEVVGESRALVVGNLLSKSLKRAPLMMTRYYKRSNAIGLRELLSVFNCQSVPAGLLDYAVFKEKYKGAETEQILAELDNETTKIHLPQIVYTANCVAFYPPINQFTEDNRAAVALGFETGNYLEENEVVWIAAEVDSKLEATAELAEFWCDRLEMVALMCNFINYNLWLITPEGFSPEALEVLKNRRAYGTSRHQIEFLVKRLHAENLIKEQLKPNEYEMIVPMGDDTEMIAAHAVEDIARRHNFQPRAINQIKTALVEACINASEHSLSPDRKIYQKFTVEDDKIIITISNRGIKIPNKKVAESVVEIEPSEGRRGWGLKLMRNLMDEVKFEQVDDGTRISMVKYLKK
jgi:serine/threonine-protein kinase RsbW